MGVVCRKLCNEVEEPLRWFFGKIHFTKSCELQILGMGHEEPFVGMELPVIAGGFAVTTDKATRSQIEYLHLPLLTAASTRLRARVKAEVGDEFESKDEPEEL